MTDGFQRQPIVGGGTKTGERKVDQYVLGLLEDSIFNVDEDSDGIPTRQKPSHHGTRA